MNKPEIKSGIVNPTQSPSAKKISREELAKQLRKMRDRDAEMVTGIFKNLENPARNGSLGAVKFCIKLYHGDPLQTYELLDGERYRLPRGVARHLNNNCYYKEYEQVAGQPGMQMGLNHTGRSYHDGLLRPMGHAQIAKKVHRYAFHSLEYMDDDIDMYPADVLEVTLNP